LIVPFGLPDVFSKLPMNNEKLCQSEIEQRLTNLEIDFERECKIGPGSYIDFLIGDVGVEVKLKGQSRSRIQEQIRRYAKFDQVGKILLVTGTAIHLPAFIESKPCRTLSLGASWL